jgi:hypothetical protein
MENGTDEIAFNNNAALTTTGTLNADAGDGTRTRFVSAAYKGKGLEIVGAGQLKMRNGGQMKIYE